MKRVGGPALSSAGSRPKRRSAIARICPGRLVTLECVHQQAGRAKDKIPFFASENGTLQGSSAQTAGESWPATPHRSTVGAVEANLVVATPGIRSEVGRQDERSLR
jgi:hypothetical protein